MRLSFKNSAEFARALLRKKFRCISLVHSVHWQTSLAPWNTDKIEPCHSHFGSRDLWGIYSLVRHSSGGLTHGMSLMPKNLVNLTRYPPSTVLRSGILQFELKSEQLMICTWVTYVSCQNQV